MNENTLLNPRSQHPLPVPRLMRVSVAEVLAVEAVEAVIRGVLIAPGAEAPV